MSKRHSFRSRVRHNAACSNSANEWYHSLSTSIQTVPSLVRPVRPARCLACACDTQTMCALASPVAASHRTSHARHESMTWVTCLMVMLDSATAEAITMRALAPSSPRSAAMLSSMSTLECNT